MWPGQPQFACECLSPTCSSRTCRLWEGGALTQNSLHFCSIQSPVPDDSRGECIICLRCSLCRMAADTATQEGKLSNVCFQLNKGTMHYWHIPNFPSITSHAPLLQMKPLCRDGTLSLVQVSDALALVYFRHLGDGEHSATPNAPHNLFDIHSVHPSPPLKMYSSCSDNNHSALSWPLWLSVLQKRTRSPCPSWSNHRVFHGANDASHPKRSRMHKPPSCKYWWGPQRRHVHFISASIQHPDQPFASNSVEHLMHGILPGHCERGTCLCCSGQIMIVT